MFHSYLPRGVLGIDHIHISIDDNEETTLPVASLMINCSWGGPWVECNDGDGHNGDVMGMTGCWGGNGVSWRVYFTKIHFKKPSNYYIRWMNNQPG